MNKKAKLIVLMSICIIVIIVAILIVFSFRMKHKNKVEKTLEGVVISKDTGEVLEYVTITINGYLNNDKNSSVFRGEFLISNIEHTHSEYDAFLSYSVGYGEDGWDKRGILFHPTYIWKEGYLHPHHAMTHWVEMDLDFSYLILANYEEDGIYHDTENTELVFNGTDIMVFPAHDAASAKKIIEEHQVDKGIFTKTMLIDMKLIVVP